MAWRKETALEAISHGLLLPRSRCVARLPAIRVGEEYEVEPAALEAFVAQFEAEEPGRHPPISIRRTLATEARHCCAICRQPLPLQYHHIIAWSELKHFDARHMLAVCGGCHSRIQLGHIDLKAQYVYKEQLKLQPVRRDLTGAEATQNRPTEVPETVVMEGTGPGINESAATATQTATLDVEITLPGHLCDFSDHQRRSLLAAIENILDAQGNIHITHVREGSIKLTIALTPAQAERLIWAHRRGELDSQCVSDVVILGPSAISDRVQDDRLEIPPRPARRLPLDDERLLTQIMSGEQDFIDSPAFYESGAEKKIYADALHVPELDSSWYQPVIEDLSNISSSRPAKKSRQVFLTSAEEKTLFRQFNYARYRVWKIQEDVKAIANKRPTAEQADEILRWFRRSDRIREQIVESNLTLVLAMAKRTGTPDIDFADVVSEGNMALLRAVDKFDAECGYKFSTYACRAILKAISRQLAKLSKRRQRFPADFDPKLESSNFLETKRAEFEKDAAEEVKRLISDNRVNLTELERTVLLHRFGLDETTGEKVLTLEQVGQLVSKTKEEVRQIQNRAMEKIRLELEAAFPQSHSGDNASPAQGDSPAIVKPADGRTGMEEQLGDAT